MKKAPVSTLIPFYFHRKLSRKFNFSFDFSFSPGDTYFSGKMLAKFARIIMITKELIDICSPINGDVPSSCDEIEIPSEKIINDAIARLRRSTEIWINGTAMTPFVYDRKWGGIASCGCHFNQAEQTCDNVFPECPSFDDPGLDFGHAFYNDHHFHQGYHIYAAAAVSYLDPEWGKTHFEHVLVMIRDIAKYVIIENMSLFIFYIAFIIRFVPVHLLKTVFFRRIE